MEVGDRLRPSEQGLQFAHLFPDPSVRATVVRPGMYRGGARVYLLIDGEKRPRSWCPEFWEVVPATSFAMTSQSVEATASIEKCDECRKDFLASEAFVGFDPYLEDIADRKVETTLCRDCLRDNVQGI